MSTDALALVWFMTHVCISDTKEIFAKPGDAATFNLPSVAECGNYQFLNPQLLPLLVIKSKSAAAIQGAYIKRTSVYVLNSNELQLTLENVTPADSGEYRIFTKTGDVDTCSKINHYLEVRAKAIEYLNPWSPWGECLSQCDPSAQRNRERNCSVPGGCGGLGPRIEWGNCPLHQDCPEWSEWSGWTKCSSCHWGNKTRNRTCIYKTTTEKALNVSCTGDSVQNKTCQSQPCEANTTFWSSWGPWGPCNLTCGGGYRQRTRASTFPQSEIVASFAGWSVDEERCNIFKCEYGIVCPCPQKTGNQLENTEEPSGAPVVALIIGCAIVVFIIILLLVILLLVVRLRKRGLSLHSIANSFRRSVQRSRNKSITSPAIPRKASEPNAYSGVKVGSHEKKRMSDFLKKHNKRKSEGEIASTGTLSVDSISYTKRAKSGKVKQKKISLDDSNEGKRTSGSMHKTSVHKRTELQYEAPRSSKHVTEVEIEPNTVDADDTYEIPENPAWDEVSPCKRIRTPEIIVTNYGSKETESKEFSKNKKITNFSKLTVNNDFSEGLKDTLSVSPSSSPRCSSKFSSSLGLFNLYDTPRSSTSNLAELVYDVPQNNEPLYENDNFEIDNEEFYVTPKTSVSSVTDTRNTTVKLPQRLPKR